jgi:putative tricarboxylic transport membrane protein
MGVMGLFGYVLLRVRIPIAPVVLGLVLGETLEHQYRTALILSEGSHRIFVSSAPAVIFLSLTALTIGWQIWSALRTRFRA